MRARLFLLATILAVWSAAVSADQGAQYSGWAEGPAGFVMTKAELKEWRAITSDSQARRFVELFWARRDPNLQTPVNELKAVFDRNVARAEHDFAYEGMAGALSDRGKVLILLGTPHRVEKRAPTETVEKMDDMAAGSDEVRANAEVWYYDPSLLPAAFKVKGTRLVFVFYERKSGTNEFVLDRSHPEAARGLKAMGNAPEVWLLHPDLTEPPKPVSAYGGQAADSAHLGWLGAAATPWSERVQVLLEPGVADATLRPLWVEVILPLAAPPLEELAGRVLTPDGEVASTFQIAAKPLEGGDYRIYHLTFPIEPGTYRVELAGGAGGQVQFVHSGEVEVGTIPADSAWMSPLWVGLAAEREEGAPLGAAYCFGGWHLVPMVDSRASRQDELSYFGFIAHPGVTAEGTTNLTSKVLLKQGDKRLGQPFTSPLPSVELAPGLHLFANALSLSGLPELGEYALEFTIKDLVSGATVERTVTLTVTE